MEKENKQIFRDRKLWFIAQNPESDTQNFYTIKNGWFRFHHQCRVKELHGRRIQACFHGWAILSDRSDNTLWSLWNPLTSSFIRLPPLITTNKKKDLYACCLSSPPEDQASVFLLFSATIPTVFVCLLGPKRKRLYWTEWPYDKQLWRILREDDARLLQRPACCNGKVYAIAFTFVVQVDIVIDIVVGNEDVVIRLLPIVRLPDYGGPGDRCPSLNNIADYYPFLKGHCTELFYIDVCSFDDGMIIEVNLFKLDMVNKKWKQVVDLEDGVIFLDLARDYFTCYYNNCAVDSKKFGGCIHVIHECGKVIYSSHVKDRTLSLSLLCRPVRESAMLEWRLEADDAEEEVEEVKDTKVAAVRQVKGEFGIESGLVNMPLHILQLITKSYIGIEYMKFRATCKHFSLAAPAIQWRSKKSMRGYALVSPWLMVLDNCKDTITFIDPLFGDRYFIKTPRELTGAYMIHYSRYGWLLMYKNKCESRRLVLYNPFTCNIIELPEIKYMGSFCFTAPPTSPDCVVVGLSPLEPTHIYIHYVSGESNWHRLNLNYNIHNIYIHTWEAGKVSSFHFATYNGRHIYAWCNNERVEAFTDFIGNDYSRKLVADKPPRRSQAQYFLSTCNQHLLLVIVGEFGRSVEVFKVGDPKKNEWEKIDDLGKHMIYIGNTSCFCLEAKSPEMGNKIYFPRLLDDDNTKLVFYSLETCTYHTFDDKRKIQDGFGADWFGTKHFCRPHAWIEPSWS